MLTKTGISLFLLLIAVTGLRAQNPTYLCELRNDLQVDAKTYEFDVYLLRTGATPFELTNMQFGININPGARNGGTISVSLVDGSSGLLPVQIPTPIKFSFNVAKNCINMVAMAGPGPGSGTMISNTSPGTRVGTIRISNTVNFGSVQPNLLWSFSNITGYQTKVNAYVGGLAIDITVQASHTYSLTNATLNAPPAAFAVTGAGSYCEGTLGLPVGVANSETGVTYTLYKDASAQVPTVAGTGSAISFGDQTEGTYTVYGTNGNGTTAMTGDAVLTMNPLPGAAEAISGLTTVTEGNTGVAYSVAAINDATSYSWTYSGTGVTIHGTTNDVTLDFAMDATGGQLTVVGNNACGNGPSSSAEIIVLSIPTLAVWNGSVNSSWINADNWSTIPVGATFPGAATAVTIPAGVPNYPTLSDARTCQSITISSGASLLDNGFLTVTGLATVERDIDGGAWHLISSPVSNAVSGMFTGKYLQQHYEDTNLYSDVTALDLPLTPSKGFALYSAANFTAQFTGTLNIGSQGINTTYSGANLGWNLVGNPYPSSIDWDATSGWTKTGLNSATYLHTAAASWATYINGIGINGGTQFIAPGQGFFVQATSDGRLGMNNGVRVHENATFFKNSSSVVNNLIRLQVSGNGYTDEAVVWFQPEATAEFDGAFDAHKLFGDVAEAAQLYTLGTTPLAINSLPETNTVPVGVHAGVSGTYSINAIEINDFTEVTLEDTKTGVFTDMMSNSYSFGYTAGENEQRFVLHLGALVPNGVKNSFANIYSYSRSVYVEMKYNESGDILIYNTSGQLVTTAPASLGTNKISLATAGIYIVKVISDKSSLVKKVWIQ